MEKIREAVYAKLATIYPLKDKLVSLQSIIDHRLQEVSEFRTPSHPPYASMIHLALAESDEGSGMTEEEISDFMKNAYVDLPYSHRRLLSYHLRAICSKGEIVSDGERYRIHIDDGDEFSDPKRSMSKRRQIGDGADQWDKLGQMREIEIVWDEMLQEECTGEVKVELIAASQPQFHGYIEGRGRHIEAEGNRHFQVEDFENEIIEEQDQGEVVKLIMEEQDRYMEAIEENIQFQEVQESGEQVLEQKINEETEEEIKPQEWLFEDSNDMLRICDTESYQNEFLPNQTEDTQRGETAGMVNVRREAQVQGLRFQLSRVKDAICLAEQHKEDMARMKIDIEELVLGKQKEDQVIAISTCSAATNQIMECDTPLSLMKSTAKTTIVEHVRNTGEDFVKSPTSLVEQQSEDVQQHDPDIQKNHWASRGITEELPFSETPECVFTGIACTPVTDDLDPQDHTTTNPNIPAEYYHQQQQHKCVIGKLREALFAKLDISKPVPPALENHIEKCLKELVPTFCTPSHLPYASMIQAAIMYLNEEDGSTEDSISQFIKNEYKDLPWAHESLLRHHLRKLSMRGEVVHTNSRRYMLPDEGGISDCYHGKGEEEVGVVKGQQNEQRNRVHDPQKQAEVGLVEVIAEKSPAQQNKNQRKRKRMENKRTKKKSLYS